MNKIGLVIAAQNPPNYPASGALSVCANPPRACTYRLQ